MTLIKPFKALRPQPQFAKQVASRPYDVLNSAEAKIEAQQSKMEAQQAEIETLKKKLL